MANESHPFEVVSVLIFGAAVGAASALFFSTNDEGTVKPKIKAKIKLFKRRLQAGEEWVSDKAGEAAAQVSKALDEAKVKIEAKVADLKLRFGEVDKEKYAQAVNEVLEQMKEVGEVTNSQAKTISKYLMEDYQTMAAAPAPAPTKTPVPAKKSRKAK
jgi:hypothetical protein